MIVQAYDVGGTWIRAANIKDGHIGKIIKERTEPDFIAQIQRISKGFRKADCISLALPGPVQEGILLSAPPLGIKQPLDLREQLSSLEKKVIVENDLNAAVLAEDYRGYGKEWDNFYLLSLSTGIGAGIIINGKPVKGGEFGHNTIRPLGYPNHLCICGKRDCWCAFSSGKGMENLAQRLATNYHTAEEVCEAYRNNEQDAMAIVEIAKNANAQGLAMMINALEVEGIVIMGSLGLEQFDILIPTEKEIKEYALNPVPKIVKTKLGDTIGLLGAYYRALS